MIIYFIIRGNFRKDFICTSAPITKYKAKLFLNFEFIRDKSDMIISKKLRQLRAVPVAMSAGGFSRKHFGL